MGRITSREVRRVGKLDAATQQALATELVPIVRTCFQGPDNETIRRRVLFRHPEARLAMFREETGALAGFMSCAIDRVPFEGSMIGVMDAGMYLRPEHRGDSHWGLRVMLEMGIAFRLRHPRTPLCYIGEVTSPAAYRAACRSMPAVFPSRAHAPTDRMTRLVDAVMRQRDFGSVDGDPWRVRVPLDVRFADDQRMQAFVERTDDPDIDWYLQRNPGYAGGDWLVIYVPMGLRGLLASGLQAQVRRKRERSRRGRGRERLGP